MCVKEPRKCLRIAKKMQDQAVVIIAAECDDFAGDAREVRMEESLYAQKRKFCNAHHVTR